MWHLIEIFAGAVLVLLVLTDAVLTTVTFALEEVEPRRTRLRRLVVSDGWSWSVTGTR